MLFDSDPDACCALRKVAPLRRALTGFHAWISGRKRYQGALRAFMPVIEASGEKIKINPLARWTRERIEAEFAARNLPRHPLEADGLPLHRLHALHRARGTGCGGRWRPPRRPLGGREKTECGIHL